MGRGQMAHLILKLTRSQPYKWNLLWNLVEFPSLWIQNCCCHDYKFSSYALFFFHGDCVQMIYFLAWSHENYSTLHEKYLWHGIFFSCTKREYIPMWFFSCDLRTHTLTCIINFNDISGFYMNKKTMNNSEIGSKRFYSNDLHYENVLKYRTAMKHDSTCHLMNL